ncbi:MAG: zinc-binding alcohol dehydrogenase family protein [Bacteroidota bacterium]
MKVLTCTSPGAFEYSEQSIPTLSKNHAIIKIKRIGICGTDLHAFEGTQPYFNYPRVLGHELAGELIDADGADDFKKGEIVTLIPYFNCGSCIACRSGTPNCCVNLKVFGVHIDGGMKEYISVPSSSLMHGMGLPVDTLALAEPLAIGAHGIRRANVKPGEFVLIVGAGPIGLGLMEFAKIAGANVIALDINQQRLEFCRSRLNINHVINAASADALASMKEITNDDMPTVVIDATGSLKAINNSFQFLAHGGRYVLVGLQKGEIGFSHPEFHKREGTLMSSRNATREDFDLVLNALKTKKIDPTNYITHRVSFDDVPGQFEHWLLPGSGVIKAMVEIRE